MRSEVDGENASRGRDHPPLSARSRASHYHIRIKQAISAKGTWPEAEGKSKKEKGSIQLSNFGRAPFDFGRSSRPGYLMMRIRAKTTSVRCTEGVDEKLKLMPGVSLTKPVDWISVSEYMTLPR